MTKRYSHLLSEEDHIKDDKAFTQDDVVDADQVYLVYNKYQSLGEITPSEIQVLKKFNII
jgi:hypothetical protein